MDLIETIRQLRIEKEKVERAISLLEQLEAGNDHAGTDLPLQKRRGRKSMGMDERMQVALRMRRYWASRRRLGAQE